MVTDEQFQELKSDIRHGFKRVDDQFKHVDEQFKRVDDQFKHVNQELQALGHGLNKLGVYFDDMTARLNAEREGYRHLVDKVDGACDDIRLIKDHLGLRDL